MRASPCVMSARPEAAEDPSAGTQGNWQEPIPSAESYITSGHSWTESEHCTAARCLLVAPRPARRRHADWTPLGAAPTSARRPPASSYLAARAVRPAAESWIVLACSERNEPCIVRLRNSQPLGLPTRQGAPTCSVCGKTGRCRRTVLAATGPGGGGRPGDACMTPRVRPLPLLALMWCGQRRGELSAGMLMRVTAIGCEHADSPVHP